MLVGLTEPAAGRRDTAGGKGVGLHQLSTAGFSVPPGLVLTTAAHWCFLEAVAGDTSPQNLVKQAVEDEKAREQLVQLHQSTALPESVSVALGDAVARIEALCPHGWAVRSSAVDEDGGKHSLAGLHRTHLGVPSSQLEHAVRDCWASLWAERAVSYRANAVSTEPAMALVLQPVISAAASAVVFTHDPSGPGGRIRVEAVRGCGEPLVSGEANPDTYLLDRISLRSVGASDQDGFQHAVEGESERALNGATDPVFSPMELERLGDLSLRAERYFGLPLDIEVCCDVDRYIWFTQARAITTKIDFPTTR